MLVGRFDQLVLLDVRQSLLEVIFRAGLEDDVFVGAGGAKLVRVLRVCY